MNPLFHFLLSYVVIAYSLGNAHKCAPYILLFSILPDFDHIPYILKFKKEVLNRKFGAESRSMLHELPGLALLSLIISASSLFLGITLIKVAAISLVLHYALDFLVGKTRPFYPFSKEEVFLGICPEKLRVPFEIFSTLALGVLAWLSLKG